MPLCGLCVCAVWGICVDLGSHQGDRAEPLCGLIRHRHFPRLARGQCLCVSLHACAVFAPVCTHINALTRTHTSLRARACTHTHTHQFARTCMHTRTHAHAHCSLLRVSLCLLNLTLSLPSGAAPLVPTLLPLLFPSLTLAPSASPSLPRTPLPSLLFTPLPSPDARAPAQLPFFATGALLLGSAIMAWSIPSALWQASPEAKPPAAGAPPVTPQAPVVAPPPSAPQPTDSDR